MNKRIILYINYAGNNKVYITYCRQIMRLIVEKDR